MRWAGREVARHRLVAAGSPPQWDAAHRRAAEAEALGRARGGLRLVPPAPEAGTPAATRIELPAGDWDVDAPDLGRYGCGCDGRGL